MSTKNKLTISPEMSKYITEYTNKSLEKYKKTNNYNWNDFIHLWTFKTPTLF